MGEPLNTCNLGLPEYRSEPEPDVFSWMQLRAIPIVDLQFLDVFKLDRTVAINPKTPVVPVKARCIQKTPALNPKP